LWIDFCFVPYRKSSETREITPANLTIIDNRNSKLNEQLEDNDFKRFFQAICKKYLLFDQIGLDFKNKY
jgi:hypothetical protein